MRLQRARQSKKLIFEILIFETTLFVLRFANETLEACKVIDYEYNICNAMLNQYHVAYKSDGDLMLGGLFPVHLEQACSMLEDMGTIQRLEAMPYAVQQVNEKNMFKVLFKLYIVLFCIVLLKCYGFYLKQ